MTMIEQLDQFEQGYAERAGWTIDQLREMGRFAAPCSCSDEGCTGWAMRSAEVLMTRIISDVEERRRLAAAFAEGWRRQLANPLWVSYWQAHRLCVRIGTLWDQTICPEHWMSEGNDPYQDECEECTPHARIQRLLDKANVRSERREIAYSGPRPPLSPYEQRDRTWGRHDPPLPSPDAG